MNRNYADLHVHTTYSDGTLTPAQAVDAAVRGGVRMLSICDHNVIEGALEAAPIARAAGIEFVPGVELDSMLLGCDTHILCYGADFTNEPLLRIIRDARWRLDKMSDDLLIRMDPDYPALDVDEYNRMPMDRTLGGWKLLQYLVQKGVTKSLKEAMPFYDQYGVTYEQAGFLPTKAVVDAIHAADGAAVLAHPEVTFGDKMEEGLLAALECGIDGVECYYPKHSPELVQRLRDFCEEHGLLMTAGSDCHGAFGRSSVGDPQATVGRMRLSREILEIMDLR